MIKQGNKENVTNIKGPASLQLSGRFLPGWGHAGHSTVNPPGGVFPTPSGSCPRPERLSVSKFLQNRKTRWNSLYRYCMFLNEPEIKETDKKYLRSSHKYSRCRFSVIVGDKNRKYFLSLAAYFHETCQEGQMWKPYLVAWKSPETSVAGGVVFFYRVCCLLGNHSNQYSRDGSQKYQKLRIPGVQGLDTGMRFRHVQVVHGVQAFWAIPCWNNVLSIARIWSCIGLDILNSFIQHLPLFGAMEYLGAS